MVTPNDRRHAEQQRHNDAVHDLPAGLIDGIAERHRGIQERPPRWTSRYWGKLKNWAIFCVGLHLGGARQRGGVVVPFLGKRNGSHRKMAYCWHLRFPSSFWRVASDQTRKSEKMVAPRTGLPSRFTSHWG